jgi:hypothetical protein
MEMPEFTAASPIAVAEKRRGINRQAAVGDDLESRDKNIGAESELFVAGTIVDSWVEFAPPANARDRLVLQVAPRGHAEGLVIVEADPSLVSDRLWLEDLSANLCHGTLVLALGSRSSSGIFAATRLQLTR